MKRALIAAGAGVLLTAGAGLALLHGALRLAELVERAEQELGAW